MQCLAPGKHSTNVNYNWYPQVMDEKTNSRGSYENLRAHCCQFSFSPPLSSSIHFPPGPETAGFLFLPRHIFLLHKAETFIALSGENGFICIS